MGLFWFAQPRKRTTSFVVTHKRGCDVTGCTSVGVVKNCADSVTFAAGIVNVVGLENEFVTGALPLHCENHCPVGGADAVNVTVAPGAKLPVVPPPLSVPFKTVTVNCDGVTGVPPPELAVEPDAMLMFQPRCKFVPSESVAFTNRMTFPAAAGVPEIMPLVLFNLKPAGNMIGLHA